MPLGICSSHSGVLALPRTTVHSCLCWPKHLMLCADSTWVITASLSPGTGLADMLLGHGSRLCALWTLGRLNVLVGTGTCTGEAKYALRIPSAVTREPAVLMLALCFSTSPEIFRGSSYLAARTNTVTKMPRKPHNNDVEGVKTAECELDSYSCRKLKGVEKWQERETNEQWNYKKINTALNTLEAKCPKSMVICWGLELEKCHMFFPGRKARRWYQLQQQCHALCCSSSLGN